MFWYIVLTIVCIVFVACVFGYLTYLILSAKGYQKYFWIGYVFGAIGMLFAIGMPDLKKMRLLKEINNNFENIKIVEK